MFLSAQAKLLRQRLQICARRDQAPSLAITGFDERHCIFRANAKAAALDYTDRSLTSLFNAKMFAERLGQRLRSEEHTSELQSLMRNSYAVFCLKKKTRNPCKLEHVEQTLVSQSH